MALLSTLAPAGQVSDVGKLLILRKIAMYTELFIRRRNVWKTRNATVFFQNEGSMRQLQVCHCKARLYVFPNQVAGKR